MILSGKVHIFVYVRTMENKDKFPKNAYPRFCWNRLFLRIEHECYHENWRKSHFQGKTYKKPKLSQNLETDLKLVTEWPPRDAF